MPEAFLLLPPDDDRYCELHDFPGDLKNSKLPERGRSIAGLFEEVRDYRMSKEAKGIQVADVIENVFGYLMVSARMKEIIEANAKGATIEYLPFRLINHKRRVAADPCFIVNVLGTVDCADKARSKGVETAFYKGEFFIARKLTLIDAKVPRDTNLFRTSLFPRGIWVGRDLRDAMESAQLAVRFCASGEEL